MEQTILGDFFDQTPPETCLVIADPPYGGIVDDAYDQISESQLVDFLNRFMTKCDTFVLEGGSVFIWGGIGTPRNRPFLKFTAHVEDLFPEWHLRDILTWKKARGYGSAARYLFTREEVLWLVRGPTPAVFNKPYLQEKHSECTTAILKGRHYQPHSAYKRRSNVWTDIPEIMRSKLVSAQKPTKLYEVLIKTHSNPGDLVVDPFAGSFTTGVVARQTGRQFWLCEKDSKVFELGCARLKEIPQTAHLFEETND